MPRISAGSSYGICRVDQNYNPIDWLKGIYGDSTLSITMTEKSAKHWKTREGAASFLNKNSADLPKFVVLPINS